MTIEEWASVMQAFAAVAIVIFAALSAWTAMGALREARRQANAASAALVAANASVTETRRQAQFARVPLVRLDRPQLALDPRGGKYLAIEATNLGPGPALEVQLRVERQDDPNGGFFSDLRAPRRQPLLLEGATVKLQHDAADLANLNADWEDGMRAAGTGRAPARPPLVTTRLRMRLTYLSMLGAWVEQVHIWETDRIELPPDPWTWRLERMTINPGTGNGEPIEVQRPD
jgi:hypothetical protein